MSAELKAKVIEEMERGEKSLSRILKDLKIGSSRENNWRHRDEAYAARMKELIAANKHSQPGFVKDPVRNPSGKGGPSVGGPPRNKLGSDPKTRAKKTASTELYNLLVDAFAELDEELGPDGEPQTRAQALVREHLKNRSKEAMALAGKLSPSFKVQDIKMEGQMSQQMIDQLQTFFQLGAEGVKQVLKQQAEEFKQIRSAYPGAAKLVDAIDITEFVDG